MKKTNLLFILGFVLLISCTKDNNYPKKFVRYEFHNGEVRLVTKSGEVNNNEEINKFTERVRNFMINNMNPADYVYSFEDDVNFMKDNDIEIVFTSETKGTIRMRSDDNNDYQTIGFKLLNNDYYILSLNEVIESYFYIEDPRFRCTPEIIEKVPLPMGQEIVKYRKPLYIKKNGDEISVCIVSYMETSYSSDNTLQGISISGAKNNMINEEYFKLIQSSKYKRIDSIAFKESYIRFK